MGNVIYREHPISSAFDSISNTLSRALEQKIAGQFQEEQKQQERAEVKQTLGAMGQQIGGQQGALLSALAESEADPLVVQKMLPQLFQQQQQQEKQQYEQEQQQRFNQALGLQPQTSPQQQPVMPDQMQQQAIQQQQPTQIQPQQEPFQPQVPSVQESPMKDVSEDMLTRMSYSKDPVQKAVASAELKRRDVEMKSDQKKIEMLKSDRAYHSPLANKYLENIQNKMESVRTKNQSIDALKRGIEGGAQTFGSRDWMADKLGSLGVGLRTAKGAEFDFALKEFLLGGISRAGARPNQWIEQQIAKMLPRRGYSESANNAIIESMDAGVALEQKEIDLAGELSEKAFNELGFVPFNIGKQVNESLKAYEQRTNDKLAYKIQQNIDVESKDIMKDISKKVSKGTPLTLDRAQALVSKYKDPKIALKVAKKLGYTIPSADDMQYYMQEGY
jgi:hypothetical protein